MNPHVSQSTLTKQFLGLNKQQLALIKLLLPFLLSSVLCCLLITIRVIRTDNFRYSFLIWNLFLAWVPLFFAYFLYRQQLPKGFFSMPKLIISNKEKIIFIVLLGFWLLFFPNAPYIISDLIHLRYNKGNIVWFDAALFFCFAATGSQVGLLSLYLVQKTLNNAFGFWSSWLFVGLSIWLSGLGIYMGRELRFNSWDLFTEPLHLLQSTFQQLTIHSINMTLLYATLIGAIYLIFRSLLNIKLE